MTAKKVKEKTHRDIVRKVLKHPKISFEARALWLLLESRTCEQSWFCCIGMQTLSTESGHSIAWVKRYIKELEREGFIRIGKRIRDGIKVNEYALNIP